VTGPADEAPSIAILARAREGGASLAGFCGIADLKTAPSFTLAPRLPGAGGGVGTRRSDIGLEPGEVAWPEGARSVLVIALEHPADRPEMDWWFGRSDPPGNRMLADIVQRLCEWIPEAFGIRTDHLPYHVERGGTYLKDAAAMAGLGCIGRNNLLVTRQYGSRVRLRALTLDAQLPSAGPLGFDPCAGCGAPCLTACPQGAFDRQVYHPSDCGLEQLPGRTGHFSRVLCNLQMEADIETATEEPVPGSGARTGVIRYCRACELSCPVGSSGSLSSRVPNSHAPR
jgi:epoxyqueuosine reductase